MLKIMRSALAMPVKFMPSQPGARSCNQMPSLGLLVSTTDYTMVIIPELYILRKNFIKLNFKTLPGTDVLPLALLLCFLWFGLWGKGPFHIVNYSTKLLDRLQHYRLQLNTYQTRREICQITQPYQFVCQKKPG